MLTSIAHVYSSHNISQSISCFRREPKSKKRDEDDYNDRRNKDRHRSRYRDDDYEDNRRRSKHRDDGYESDSDNRNRRNRSKHRKSYDDTDDFNDESDNRRRSKQKYRDSDYDDNDYDQENIRDRGHKGRTRNNEKGERSGKDSREKRKDRKGSKDRDSKTLDTDEKNTSGDKLGEVEVSPRDKVGLPNDLSWRHMTKAERLRLNMARQRFLEEEER